MPRRRHASYRPNPVSIRGSRRKSLLLLFFRKEESSFSEEKEAKRLLILSLWHTTYWATGG
jgi:hypothetical protein